MPKFNFIATRTNGKREKGVIRAINNTAAAEKLKSDYKFIISLRENKDEFGLSIFNKPKLSLQDKVTFTKNLSMMVKVGINITEALEIIGSQTKKQKNLRMYQNIVEMIKSGQSLSKSLEQYPQVFSEIFINMVAVGEKTGTLDKSLEQLETQLEKQHDLRSKVISALIYPVIIITITLLLVLAIVVFIIPKILQIFNSFDVTLPLPTRMVIALSNFILQTPLLALGTAAGTIGFFTFLFKWRALKPFWTSVLSHLPLIGTMMKFVNIAQFSQALTSLLQAGVPLIEAVKISKNIINNVQYKESLERIRQKIENGEKFGEAMDQESEKLFPIVMSKMIMIGERSGNLETTTQYLTEMYEKKVNNLTKNLTVLMEPFLLLFMAGMVGSVALAIILPIYQLPNLIG